ncbi:hypothetical protein DSO57_1039613 [Entomophthora muscae]|uniref:Uncharacterized protein n=1 Tax=Entomophthora muscae TaxID=34485 RepID=A0ACC2UBX6_9FUNG|nr:hypothetical protein DSO57_1039613 [Entomophthora muscae]
MQLLLTHMPVRHLAGCSVNFTASALFLEVPDLKPKETVEPICKVLYLQNSVAKIPISDFVVVCFGFLRQHFPNAYAWRFLPAHFNLRLLPILNLLSGWYFIPLSAKASKFCGSSTIAVWPWILIGVVPIWF